MKYRIGKHTPPTQLSKLCGALSGAGYSIKEPVGLYYEPFRDLSEVMREAYTKDRYAFGDRVIVSSKTLKNAYTKVSSGEVSNEANQ
jgi:hypothetical protein